MLRSNVRRLFVLLAWMGVACPAAAFAQKAGNEQAADAPAEKLTGQIHVVVFGPPRGLPVVGASVEVDGQRHKTDADGAAWFAVAPGHHELRVHDVSMPEASVSDVQVAGGEGAEVVLEVRADGTVATNVETVKLGHGRRARQNNAAQKAGPPGTLAGKVVSFSDGKPVVGARVFVRGLTTEAKTGKDGRFSLSVPAGEWDISVIHSEYSTASKTGVEVQANQHSEVTIEMTPASVRLDAFTVTIPRIEGGTIALLDQRKESSQVADVIGAEQFSKTGDSNAAAALGRVTGLTVVGGKYVYVRGLGGRYSSSLLDGSSLPSPDPERRAVPLDLFPTSVLESVVVQKTYSADMPGGFGGGVIRMRTRSFPSKFSAGVELSLGGNTMTTFGDGLDYQGGSLDWLGIDDGTRALPASVRAAAAKTTLKESGTFSSSGYSPAKLEKIGEAMPDNYDTNRNTVLPDLGISANIGDTTKLFDLKTGYRLALSYDNSHDINRWHEGFFTRGDPVPKESYDFNERVDTVTLSAMLAGGIKFDKNNKIELTSMLTRLTDNSTKVYQGVYDVDQQIRMTRLRWLERQLMFHQIRGEHVFPGWHKTKLEWRYAFGQARRDEPDRRDYRYDWLPRVNDWVLSPRPDGNTRLYSNLVDNSHDLGAAVTVPFGVWSSLQAKLKAGADFMYKSRAVSTRQFAFTASTPPPEEARTASPEQIFTPQNIGHDGYQLTETTRSTDNYTASHTIIAPYLLATVPITKTLALTGGVRLENSAQEVTTTPLFSGKESTTTLDRLDVLPSLSATWKFVEHMQLRGAVARTVNRPDLRELSPACFTTVVGASEVCGNPDLDRASITHFDARWEWYPSRGESVSVGTFLKLFDKPIEKVLLPAAPLQENFRNALGATNYGVEFDARKKLGFLSDAFRDFYVAGNVALIQSTIRIPHDKDVQLTNYQRPLQGQSPYVLNLQFGYENADTGTRATMLYNVYGKRITDVGSHGIPDTYEQPDHVIDFTFSQRLSDQLKLGFKAKNLLDANQPNTVGEATSRTQYQGRSFSAKISWNY